MEAEPQEVRVLGVDRAKYYRSQYPYYKQPTEIGHFSQDDQRTVFMDRREARRCRLPQANECREVNWDLNNGFEEFQWRDEEKVGKEGINPILDWIMAEGKVLDRFKKDDTPPAKASALNTNFVMFRGMMTRILTAPYETKFSTPWRLSVCRFQNTIYLCDDKDFGTGRMHERTVDHEKMTYWGYSFESFLTSHIDPEVEKKSRPNNAAGFATVVRAQLASYTLLMAAEVDGELEGSHESPPSNYVELKTNRRFADARQEQSFHRHKLMRTWAQCYSVGVPTIVFGLRDDDGIVRSLRTYKTMEVHGICERFWKASVCLNFACDFFAWLDKHIAEADPLKVMYKVTFDAPFSGMTLERVDITEDKQAFLSRAFVESMAK
ncbi:decapping and exoribonuclease protein-like [Sycon ciliatum]|uniref:decapping and exoribonuclease protein-like n=1 Tax=Sycon ciliatum TaxID=27933 RepID=UPI0031F6BAF9